MLAGVVPLRAGIDICGTGSGWGVASALKYGTAGSVAPSSVGEEPLSTIAEGGYSQDRPVDRHREQAGFSRLQRTFDFVQLVQAFFRGGRCVFLGRFGALMGTATSEWVG